MNSFSLKCNDDDVTVENNSAKYLKPRSVLSSYLYIFNSRKIRVEKKWQFKKEPVYPLIEMVITEVMVVVVEMIIITQPHE